MREKTMKKVAAISLMCLVMVLLTSPNVATAAYAAIQDERQERFSQQFDIGAEGSFTLSNVSGDIVVRAGSGSQVEVEAVKRVHRSRGDQDASRQLEAVEIQVTHSGNRVRINTRYGDRDERGGRDINVSVDYQVTVPSGTEVSVKSVSGNVDVEGVRGELEAESVSGEVTVTQAEQLLLAKSVSGNVKVISASGARALEISSVSGDVESRNLRARELRLNSVSGDVEVGDASCERAELNTVSGDVRYSGTLAASGRYEFKSHSGDVRITIPGDVGFELEAQSFSGEIESDFSLTVHSIRRERKVSGVFGDGSAFINATTFSGDITIRQK
jgi:DUF4097 and DUF4098 domain-containing protein YvlB